MQTDTVPAATAPAQGELRLLRSLTRATEILHAETTFDTAINDALKTVGETSGFIRIVMLRQERVAPRNALAHIARFEWMARGWPRQSDHAEHSIFLNDDPESRHLLDQMKEFGTYTYRADNQFPAAAATQHSLGTQSYFGAPVITHQGYWGVICFDSVDLHYGWGEQETTLLKLLSTIIASRISRDEQQAVDARLAAEKLQAEQTQLRLLTAVVEASRCLAAESDLLTAIKAALDKLQTLTSLDRVYVFANNEGDASVTLIAESCGLGVRSVNAGDNVLVCRDLDFPEVLKPMRRGESVQFTTATRTGVNAAFNEVGATLSDLMVPIMVEKCFWGCIGFDDIRTARTWSESEIQVLQGAAAAIAAAVNRDCAQRANAVALLYRHEAVANERMRLSCEVHDTLSQAFTGTLLQLEALLVRQQRGEAIGDADLQRVRRVAAFGLAEARRYALVVRPLSLEEGDLQTALQQLVERSRVPDLLACEWTLHGLPRKLAISAEEALVGIAHEAINNAIRHANASRINISLHFSAQLVSLYIHDNGCGFDADALDAVGRRRTLGMASMQSRAAAIGAKLLIESTPGEGCCVKVLLTNP